MKKIKWLEQQKKKTYLLWLAVSLGILLIGYGVDLFCQRGVLSLPDQEQGIVVISDQEIEARDFEATDQGWRLLVDEEDQDGNLIFAVNGAYVNRLEVTYRCDQRVNMAWRILESGEEEWRSIEDSNSLLIDMAVEYVDAYVDRINIKFEKDYDSGELLEESELYVQEIRIVNEYQPNWYRMLFVWAVLGLAAFLILGRHWIGTHVAQAYLVAALTLGTLMILLVPANKTSWDEEVHFFHAYCVSHFGTEVKSNHILEKLFVADEENWPYSLPSNVEERTQMNETLNTMVAEQEYTYSRGSALAGIYTPSYVPSAVGIRVGLLLGLPFTAVYQLGRLANLVFCALVMAWAIHKVPVGKAMLAMIGLMPTPLFLMAMYSYDSFITALFALGFAYFLDEYFHRERTISWFSFGILALSFAIGSMPKAIYVPMILVALLLPKEKFANRKQEWLMKGIAVALFLALMASFVLPVVISPAETNDLRGGNTSEAGQIPYILSDIPRFINMMVYSIRTTFAGFTIGAPVYGSVGHLGLELLGMILPAFALVVIFADEKCLPPVGGVKSPEKKSSMAGRLTVSARLWILLMCLAVIGMVWVAMYLAFTPVGYNHVNGVQPRYYIPLLIAIYLCLCPDRIKVKVRKEWLYVGVIAICGLFTAIVIARTMLILCI